MGKSSKKWQEMETMLSKLWPSSTSSWTNIAPLNRPYGQFCTTNFTSIYVQKALILIFTNRYPWASRLTEHASIKMCWRHHFRRKRRRVFRASWRSMARRRAWSMKWWKMCVIILRWYCSIIIWWCDIIRHRIGNWLSFSSRSIDLSWFPRWTWYFLVIFCLISRIEYCSSSICGNFMIFWMWLGSW